MANTPNLGLHQWSAGDSFLRTDFNSDFSKIDTAVGAGLKCVEGTFTGNGVYPRKINLPRRPKVLLLKGVYRYVGSGYTAILIGSEAIKLTFANGQQFEEIVTFSDSGFEIIKDGYFNSKGDTTQYFCLY